MPTPQPDPRVIEYLCKEHRHVSRADIAACWKNADHMWWEVPPEVKANEPAELTAARALYVHGQLSRDPTIRAESWHGYWSLVMPYIPPRR